MISAADIRDVTPPPPALPSACRLGEPITLDFPVFTATAGGRAVAGIRMCCLMTGLSVTVMVAHTEPKVLIRLWDQLCTELRTTLRVYIYVYLRVYLLVMNT